MIRGLRKQFNASFTPDKYRKFLQRIDDVSGTHVQFRLSETPCFFPKELLDRMERQSLGAGAANEFRKTERSRSAEHP